MTRFYLSIIICLRGLSVSAAVLPPHTPLRVLIVSDEVNPHSLSNAELTQPGDLLAALTNPANGLTFDTVVEIATNDIHLATALLNLPANDPNHYDVLIFFAHRIPNDDTPLQNQTDQDNFTTAVEAFLTAGSGVIAFHHGMYYSSGKEGILSVLGATANGAVPWNTSVGQNVINVAPQHFITNNELEYPNQTTYADVANGVASSTYTYFNNTPDERYPYLTINNDAEDIEILFASNYNENGSTHILGFTHKRSIWQNKVVAYQPAEYQPNALDDFDGNNFQILANAIYYLGVGGVITGIERNENEDFRPYPNPFTESINIKGFTGVFEVFDPSGRLVERAADANATMIGQAWKPGYYILKWEDKFGEIRYNQIIKQ